MSRAPASVDATTPGVADLVGALVDLVVEDGGTVHPNLRFVERGGAMGVEFEGEAGERPLFEVPEGLLVPVDAVQWDPGPEQIAVAVDDPGLSAAQRQALELMVALYECTGKARWAATALPECWLPHDADALSVVRTVVPGFAGVPHNVAEVFVASRVLRVGRREQVERRVLMPLVDLLDHHRTGAPLVVADGTLRIPVVRIGDAPTCFASYGSRRSPLDTALHFGFTDTSAVHARSIAVDLAPPVGVTGLDAVVVQGRHALAVSRFDPPRVALEDGRLVLSHLTFDVAHPDRAPAMLALAFAGIGRQGVGVPDPHEAAIDVVRRAAAANATVLDAAASALDGADGPPSRAVVVEALRLQREIVVGSCSGGGVAAA